MRLVDVQTWYKWSCLFPCWRCADYLGYRIALYKLETVEVSDARVLRMQEILLAIKLVKFYTWEKSFAKQVSEVRPMVKQVSCHGHTTLKIALHTGSKSHQGKGLFNTIAVLSSNTEGHFAMSMVFVCNDPMAHAIAGFNTWELWPLTLTLSSSGLCGVAVLVWRHWSECAYMR